MQRRITKEAIVAAPRRDVWAAFTTTAGATAFFAPRARIELKLLGPYELLFDLDQPEGQQGSEGCRILAFLDEELLSFEWNAPPEFPGCRGEHTFVVLQLSDAGAGTKVVLTHAGFGDGAEWDRVFAYFERAWGMVTHGLRHRFEHGPIDWSAPPRPPSP